MIRFSIIIPAYNAEKTLVNCLNSILNQSFSDLEIIIINDGSTDLTSYIGFYYSRKFNFIRFFNRPNKGVSAARNYGIKQARGEYLFFLDADDMLLKNSLKNADSVLRRCSQNIDILMGGFLDGCECISFSNSVLKFRANDNYFLAKWCIDRDTEYLNHNVDVLFESNSVHKNYRMGSVNSKFIRRDKAVLFDESITYSEDLVYMSEILLRSNLVVIVPDIYYNYIYNEYSVTRKKYRKVIESNVNLSNFFSKYIGMFNKKFDNYLYEKQIICLWDSLVFDIIANSNIPFVKKINIFRYLCMHDVYANAIEKIDIKVLKRRKIKILVWLLKNKKFILSYLLGYIWRLGK